MKRFALRATALLLVCLLLLPLAACRRGGEKEGNTPLPEGATFTFSEVTNVRIEGEGADNVDPDAVFTRDYCVYVYENGEAVKKSDRVEVQGGTLTLCHHVGKDSGTPTNVGPVYDELELQRIALGSYEGGTITLTRPRFEQATYADGALTFSLVERAGDLVYYYDVIFK